MQNKNIDKLLKELETLKGEQRQLLKERFLNVPKLNIINKRMFEIREQLKQSKIKETDSNGLYLY